MRSNQPPDTDSQAGEAWTLVPRTPNEADTVTRLISPACGER
jgi:hypothetical protein